MRMPVTRVLLSSAMLLSILAGAAGPAASQTPVPSSEPATVVAVESYEWKPVRGLATDLVISANGVVHAIDRENHVWRWRGREGGWSLLPRFFTRLATDPQGKPWAVSPEGGVFRFNGLWWDRLGTEMAIDIAIGSKGEAFIVRRDGGLARWDERAKQWQPFAGSGVARVAVDGAGQPWVIDRAGAVSRFEPGDDEVDDRFVVLPGKAVDVAISPEDVVFVVTIDGAVARWNDEESGWQPLPGVKDIAVVAAGPGAFPWIATTEGRILATADFEPEQPEEEPGRAGDALTAADRETRDARSRRQAQMVVAGVTDPSPFEFVRVRAVADDIAIGRDGSVFITDTEGRIFRYSTNDSAFLQFPGLLRRIAVAPEGDPWGVDAAGRVLRHTGQGFVGIPLIDNASDIAIGADGSVFVTDRDDRLLKFDRDAGRFQDTGLAAMRVAVTPAGRVWGIRRDGVIFRCDRDPCELVPNWRGENIGIGPDGSVFVVNTQNELLRYQADRDEFERIRANVIEVAVGPRGRPWIIDTRHQVYATTFFFQPLPTVSEQSQPQLPQSSITFTKRFNFRVVKFSQAPATPREITIGRDGSVFVWDNGVFPEVSRFNEAKNILERRIDNAESAPGCTTLPISFTTSGNAAADTNELWQIGSNAFRTAVIRRLPGASPKDALRKCEVKFNELIGVPGCFMSIALGAVGNVFFVDCNQLLYTLNPETGAFVLPSPLVFADRVAVDPNGRPWIIDTDDNVRQYDGNLQQLDGRKFTGRPRNRAPQKAKRIAIGANGTVFVVDTKGFLRRYNATSDSFDLISGVKDVIDVAVTPDGFPWIIESGNIVRRGQP
jgi:hypothetical protein